MEQSTVQGGFGSLHGAQRGWAIHACVYLAVNLLFVLVALAQGRTPMFAHAIGWGVGLAIHFLIAFVVVPARRVSRA